MNIQIRNVAEMIGDAASFDAPTPLVIPAASHIREPLADGLYFELPEADYHAQPSFSTSGIKLMMASTMDFWARSFLNSEREDEAEESTPLTLGKAYHKRILEGAAAFYQRYAPGIDPGAFPKALRTVDEIKEAITLSGAKPTGKRKQDFVDQLRELNPLVQIWDELVAAHADEFKGFELLSPDKIKRIEIAAAMIERHPDLSRVFRDGYSEVSVFWHCAATGVPMKARFDYLKLKTIGDLKTISNVYMKPFDVACANAIASRGYYIQAAVYQEALAAAKAMIRQGGGEAFVHGPCDLDWVNKLAVAPAPEFKFVFQQTGVAPVARGFGFPATLTVFGIGSGLALAAKRKFADCVAAHGTGWWVDDAPIRDFDTLEFPAWIGKE